MLDAAYPSHFEATSPINDLRDTSSCYYSFLIHRTSQVYIREKQHINQSSKKMYVIEPVDNSTRTHPSDIRKTTLQAYTISTHPFHYKDSLSPVILSSIHH